MAHEKIADYTAILLAAGFGSRIAGTTDEPKCLLPLGGLTLLERHFHVWRELGLKKVNLVVGFKADAVREVAERYRDFFEIKYQLNKNFREQGNTYSLLLGLEQADGASLIFDADLVYEQIILKKFLDDPGADQILIGESDLGDIECAKALVDKNNFVRKTVDKRAVTAEELRQYGFAGEAIGIIKLSKNTTRQLTSAAKVFLSKTENIPLNWEHLMNDFLPNHEVTVHKTMQGKWIEIDTTEDYVEAESLFRR